MLENFAVMDDSISRTKCGIFIYSHCLINNGYEPKFLTIIGNKHSIYNEEKISQFLEENLFYNFALHACSHYFQMYEKVLDFVDFEINRRDCRNKIYNSNIINLFKNADCFVRNESRKQLKEIIEQSNIL